MKKLLLAISERAELVGRIGALILAAGLIAPQNIHAEGFAPPPLPPPPAAVGVPPIPGAIPPVGPPVYPPPYGYGSSYGYGYGVAVGSHGVYQYGYGYGPYARRFGFTGYYGAGYLGRGGCGYWRWRRFGGCGPGRRAFRGFALNVHVGAFGVGVNVGVGRVSF